MLPPSDLLAVDAFDKMCNTLAEEQGRGFIEVQTEMARKCKFSPKATMADMQQAWAMGL